MSKPVRIFQLVQLLGGRKSWSVEELAERLEVSERTIYRDIAELSGREIPVTNDGHRYRLLDGATFRPLALTAEEHAALKLVLDNPALLTTSDIRREIDQVQAKLDAATARSEETPGALTLAGPERSGPVTPGLTSMLDRAIRARTPTSILYRSLAGDHRKWRGVDPYEVFHRENAWYLVGRCHLHDEPRTFRLDRIAEAQPMGGVFERPAFDLDDFLQHTWTIYRGYQLHEIVIHFDASMAPLIEQASYHPDEQVLRLADGTLEFTVSLSHLDEIARWILGFAGKARAVAPDALVALVLDMAGRVYARHHPIPE